VKAIVKNHPKYERLFKPRDGIRTTLLIGGRAGMKTYQASLAINYHVVVNGYRVQVLRDEATKIKNSIMDEIFTRFDKANKDGVLSKEFSKTENSIKNIKTSKDVVFTQGFRASSNEKTSHMKGVSNVNIGVVEEMADIRDEDRFNVWKSGVRGNPAWIWMILNTPTMHHWVIKRYFNLEPITQADYPQFNQNEIDGYFKLSPKNIEGVEYIIASFRDNPYLSKELVSEYEAYGDRESPYFNPHYFLTEIEGLCSSGIKGQIFTGWNRITIEEYNRIEYNKYYYIDWGGTDPCAIGEVKAHNNQLIIKPLHYEPKRFNDVMIWLCEQGFTSKETIIVDSAIGEYMISKMRNGFNESDFDLYTLEKYPQLRRGFTAMGVVKKGLNGKGFIETRIEIMKGYNVSVVEGTEGDHLWNEYTQYVWMLDKDGKPTGQPIDKNNHHIDGSSYVAYALKT